MTDTKIASADLAATLAAVEASLWAADLRRAMGLAADAVGGGHPTLLGLAGLGRMRAGDNAGALPLFLKAREQTPRHVDLLNALGEGLEFQDEMRSFAGRAKAKNIDTPSNVQLARGLNTAGVAQWRSYAAQLEPVLPVLAPFVARFGYPEN